MTVSNIDHVAIPIENVDAMLDFYELFGFKVDTSSAPLLFGVYTETQKLNFHAPELWQNKKFTLRGPQAQPGCGDFCFHWVADLASLKNLLRRNSINIEEGPVSRVGGQGPGISIYVRDPDGNLVEFILYSID